MWLNSVFIWLFHCSQPKLQSFQVFTIKYGDGEDCRKQSSASIITAEGSDVNWGMARPRSYSCVVWNPSFPSLTLFFSGMALFSDNLTSQIPDTSTSSSRLTFYKQDNLFPSISESGGVGSHQISLGHMSILHPVSVALWLVYTDWSWITCPLLGPTHHGSKHVDRGVKRWLTR